MIDNSKISGYTCPSLWHCYHLTCESKVLPMWFYTGSGNITSAEIVSELANFEHVIAIKNLHAGIYECAAQNQHGDKYFAKLRVQMGSKFISRLLNI